MKLVKISLFGFALMMFTNVSAQTEQKQPSETTTKESQSEAVRSQKRRSAVKPAEAKQISFEALYQKELEKQATEEKQGEAEKKD